MPPRQDWIKSFARDLHDPVVLQLTPEQRWVWHAIQLLSKSFSELKGFLVSNGQGMHDREIAVALHFVTPPDQQMVVAALAACVDAGLLERTQHSGYRITTWNDRQAPEIREPVDNVRARMRRWRASKKAEEESSGVTPLRKR